MVSVSVSKIFGIGKSIGISFEKDLVPKKVSVSKKMVLEKVSDLFRFWVSSHTGIYTVLSQIRGEGGRVVDCPTQLIYIWFFFMCLCVS